MLQLSLVSGETPSCLQPDTNATTGLVEKVLQSSTVSSLLHPLRLPLPILNVGMPKTGSNTLAAFFQCVGMNGTNQEIINAEGEKEFEGL